MTNSFHFFANVMYDTTGLAGSGDMTSFTTDTQTIFKSTLFWLKEMQFLCLKHCTRNGCTHLLTNMILSTKKRLTSDEILQNIYMHLYTVQAFCFEKRLSLI